MCRGLSRLGCEPSPWLPLQSAHFHCGWWDGVSCFGRAPDCSWEPGAVAASQRPPRRHPLAAEAPCVGDDRRLLLQRNISAASQVGRKPPSSAARVIRVSAPDTHTVHNYSIQTLNSVELAKKELYREMAKVSDGAGPGAGQRAHCGRVDGGRPSGLFLLTPWPAVSGDLGAGGAAVFPLNVNPPPTAGAGAPCRPSGVWL